MNNGSDDDTVEDSDDVSENGHEENGKDKTEDNNTVDYTEDSFDKFLSSEESDLIKD